MNDPDIVPVPKPHPGAVHGIPVYDPSYQMWKLTFKDASGGRQVEWYDLDHLRTQISAMLENIQYLHIGELFTIERVPDRIDHGHGHQS